MKNATNHARHNTFAICIKNIDKMLSFFEGLFTSIAMVAISITVLYNIVMRFILHMPNLYGEEICRYLFVVGVFTSISIGVRGRSHLGITFLVDILPPKFSRMIKILVALAIGALYVFLAYICLLYTISGYRMGQLSTNMRFPLWIPFAFMVIGFFLCAVRAFMLFWNDYIDKTHPLTEIEEEVLL